MAGDAPLEGLLEVRRGHVLLESGHHGELWLGLDGLFSSPRAIAPLVTRLTELLVPHRVDVACGPMTGGALLAQLVATRLHIEWTWSTGSPTGVGGLFPVSYSVPRAQRPLLRGRRVAVLDDVVNAGSAVRSTCADVAASGGVVVALGALLVLGDRAEQLASSTGVPLEHLERWSSPLWEPDRCPRCAAGEPLAELPG